MHLEVERARAANAEMERRALEMEGDLNAGRGAESAELRNAELEYVFRLLRVLMPNTDLPCS